MNFINHEGTKIETGDKIWYETSGSGGRKFKTGAYFVGLWEDGSPKVLTRFAPLGCEDEEAYWNGASIPKVLRKTKKIYKV